MACGDTVEQWVGPAGSVWSGTLDGTQAFAVTLLPEVAALGLRVAQTTLTGITGTGVGLWVRDGNLRWTSTLAGVWDMTIEVHAQDCEAGRVLMATGGATDSLGIVHSVVLNRVS